MKYDTFLSSFTIENFIAESINKFNFQFVLIQISFPINILLIVEGFS